MIRPLACAVLLATASVAPAQLRIHQFDFEGGGGTLFVTPQGHVLMVDAGWPAGRGAPAGADPAVPGRSDAQRIADTVKAAGATRIDYLLTTHYHLDHVGGVEELVKLVPVGTFLDHGDNREVPPADATPAQVAGSSATLYARYLAAIGRSPRRSLKPAETIRLDELTITITNADAQVLAKPLPGAGKPGVGCATVQDMARNGGEENARSLGFVAAYGRARVLLLGDTTRNVENRLVCPRDLIGPIDLMIATHHGSELSNSPVVAATLRPTVVVIPNGQTKGGDPATYDAVAAAPGLKGLWQLHEAVKPGAKNAPADHIANPAGVPDAAYPLEIVVARDGAITVTNPRNGLHESYARRP